ncbi:TPA: hypothetical protein ACRZ6V_001255 [Vibrio harveyi]
MKKEITLVDKLIRSCILLSLCLEEMNISFIMKKYNATEEEAISAVREVGEHYKLTDTAERVISRYIRNKVLKPKATFVPVFDGGAHAQYIE